MSEKDSSLPIAFQGVKKAVEDFKALPEAERKKISELHQKLLIAKLRENDLRRAKSRETGGHRVVI